MTEKDDLFPGRIKTHASVLSGTGCAASNEKGTPDLF